MSAMEYPNALIEHDSRLFIFRALTELGAQENPPSDRMAELNSQMIAIVNKLSMVRPVDISRVTELQAVAKDVILRLNVGLEYGSQLDLARAAHRRVSFLAPLASLVFRHLFLYRTPFNAKCAPTSTLMSTCRCTGTAYARHRSVFARMCLR